MLGYEWVNQSPITLSAQEAGQNPPHNRPVFDPYTSQNYASPTHFLNSETHFPAPSSHHQQYQIPTNPLPNFSDPRAYTHNPQPHDSSFVLEPDGPTSFSFKQEHEPSVNKLEFNMELSSRIGLNLGRRTYFANSEDNFVNRLYRRSRILEPGLVNSPHCQAEGCNADLTLAKHYHRRHKVCEFHSKAATVVAAGLTQRFCQQCSRLKWHKYPYPYCTSMFALHFHSQYCHIVKWLMIEENWVVSYMGWSRGHLCP